STQPAPHCPFPRLGVGRLHHPAVVQIPPGRKGQKIPHPPYTHPFQRRGAHGPHTLQGVDGRTESRVQVCSPPCVISLRRGGRERRWCQGPRGSRWWAPGG